jgi:hypothetical protein
MSVTSGMVSVVTAAAVEAGGNTLVRFRSDAAWTLKQLVVDDGAPLIVLGAIASCAGFGALAVLAALSPPLDSPFVWIVNHWPSGGSQALCGR